MDWDEMNWTEMSAAAAPLIDQGLDVALALISAIIILVVGWILASWADRTIRRTLKRLPRVDGMLIPLGATVAKYGILIITLVAVLGQFGVQTASIIAVLGAAGLAIGLALQGTLQNIAAGIMLLALRPFRSGEYIEAGSVSGTVEEVNLFTTHFTTFDGVYLSVPNSQLWSSAIKNYSRNDRRRLDIEIGISYDDDMDTAMRVLKDLMDADPRILKDPAPQTMVKTLGDSAVGVNMRCWASTADYWAVLWDLNRQGKLAVEAAGCTIPFPQRDMHVILPPDAKDALSKRG